MSLLKVEELREENEKGLKRLFKEYPIIDYRFTDVGYDNISEIVGIIARESNNDITEEELFIDYGYDLYVGKFTTQSYHELNSGRGDDIETWLRDSMYLCLEDAIYADLDLFMQDALFNVMEDSGINLISNDAWEEIEDLYFNLYDSMVDFLSDASDIIMSYHNIELINKIF